jgi:hypothetical protein
MGNRFCSLLLSLAWLFVGYPASLLADALDTARYRRQTLFDLLDRVPVRQAAAHLAPRNDVELTLMDRSPRERSSRPYPVVGLLSARASGDDPQLTAAILQEKPASLRAGILRSNTAMPITTTIGCQDWRPI